MPFTRAGQLARSVLTARLDDPLALVAENLRNAPHGVLPVLDRVTWGEYDPNERRARVVGLVSQTDLSRAATRVLEPAAALSSTNGFEVSSTNIESKFHLNGHSNGAAPSSTNELASLKARDVMQSDVPIIPEVFTLPNALLMLERHQTSALPVIAVDGSYLGMVSRADLLSAMAQGIRPPLVGGMATPLGVWLSDGRLSGGAPTLGLFLSGLTLAACFACAQIIMLLGAYALSPTWGAMVLSGRLASSLDGTGIFNTIAALTHSLLFLSFLRLIPLAGVHAAEHQTVHALERGLPLEPEFVSQMPRDHPRCGTNLMGLAGLILISFQHLPEISPPYFLGVLLVTFFGWRAFGQALQLIFTTKPASPKQIESGIRAAKELMDKYQNQSFVSPPLGLRLLNGGMVPAALGMILGLSVFQAVLLYVAQSVLGG